jgi:hypothetical protein
MSRQDADAQPAEPFRIHTAPMDLADETRFLGLVTGRTFAQNLGVSSIGLAIPGLDVLRVLLTGIFNDTALEALARNRVMKIEEVSYLLVSEDHPLPSQPIPVLALGLSPEEFGRITNQTGIVCTVFVPRTEAELETYLSMYPISGEVRVQKSAQASELTDTHRERLEWFEKRYETIAHGEFGPGASQVYLGQGEPQRCRYCGDASPDVTFSTKAHAFPEQIGNKALIDLNECDRCNKHFSKWVENDFGKWTNPMRTTGRVNGKGLPTLRSSDKTFRIEATDSKNLKIQLAKDDPRYSLDTETRTVTLRMERQPYVPMGVFKCMVKMALAVMPQEESRACEHLKKWILQEGHTYESYRYRPLEIVTHFLPGPLPNDRFRYRLLRRRPEHPECLFMVFVLEFSNLVLQIILPMHNEDRAILEAGNYELALAPHRGGTRAHEETYGPSSWEAIDMSGVELVRREHAPMNWHYDELIELPPDSPDSPN